MIRQEYGDELYAAVNHNTGDEQDPSSASPTTLADNTDPDPDDHHDGLEATGEAASSSFPAAGHREGGGYQNAHEEFDLYNTDHMDQHGGAPPIAPSSVVSNEAPVNSSIGTISLPTPGTTPEDRQQLEKKHDENNTGHSHASTGDIGGRETQAAVQEGASDATFQGRLDDQGENTTATPSSEAEAAATEKGYHDDEVDDGVVSRQEGQQQQLPQREEESDDLYDIDDHGLSSSDDD